MSAGESRHPSLDGVPNEKLQRLECIMIGAKDERSKPPHLITSRVGFNSEEGNNADVEAMIEQLREKEQQLGQREQEVKKSQMETTRKAKLVVTSFKQEIEEMKSAFETQKQTTVTTIINLIRKIAEEEKKSRKEKLLRDNVRLGCLTFRRDGHIINEIWENGELFREIRVREAALKREKEEIDAQRKILKTRNKAGQTEDEKVELMELEEIISLRSLLLKRDTTQFTKDEASLSFQKLLHIKFSRLLIDESRSKYNHNPVLNSRYILLYLVGKGGFSEVYKAFDLIDHRYVAIKLHEINTDWDDDRKENFVRHAYRENAILKALNHPRIVKCYDIFLVSNNTLGTVLEFCEGEDLDMFLKRNGQLPEKLAKSIIIQIFRGLVYLNSQKSRIIHYDLKPSNILFHKGEIKIADFGLSKQMKADSTERIDLTSPGYGSYWYLPPECFASTEGSSTPKISSKVDVWSAGVILYQMLYGKRPVGDNMRPGRQLIDKILQSKSIEFPAKPSVSSATKEFISRCISGNLSQRPDVLEIFGDPYFHIPLSGSKRRRVSTTGTK